MASPVIVVHYHELWLKGHNRNFFLGKLVLALRRTLGQFPVEKIRQPGDRVVIYLAENAPVDSVVAALQRCVGVANLAVARVVGRGSSDDLGAICEAAWAEIEPLAFSTFAVRAKRSDKSFPMRAIEMESCIGRYLLDRLRAAGRDVRVKLDQPDLTCRIEVTPGPILIYARKIPGPGGLPANTTGRMLCLLSGGYDSAVAAYKMMRRGAHLSYVHFWGGGARPGESSVHVARALVEQLVRYQFSAKLYLVPFEPVQREIARNAPESYRVLLYRRMMLRIAERVARREKALAFIAGDSLGQVASQTLQNMVAVGAASSVPVFRPLAGDDKQEILALARQIGTFEISAEPFHDCCSILLPRSPALYAKRAELDEAEASLDIGDLVNQGMNATLVERYTYTAGKVERTEGTPLAAILAKKSSVEST
jgi:thiamine biosynthesis protein ThiI